MQTKGFGILAATALVGTYILTAAAAPPDMAQRMRFIASTPPTV